MAIKLTLISTKGGTGKTTTAANLGGILADMGERVLLIDADTGQPALSSYYSLDHQAENGITKLFQSNPATLNPEDFVSKTSIQGLDLIYSDDPTAQLQDWLNQQPDGRMRLKAILKAFDTLYDIIIVDTRGSVGPVQDGAAIAADMMISPIPPEMLSAREFVRGTLKMLNRLKPMEAWGFPLGTLYGVINGLDQTADAKLIAKQLRSESYRDSNGKVVVCETIIPHAVAYRQAATQQIPAHRHESRRAKAESKTPCALEVMSALVTEIFPHLDKVPPTRRSDTNSNLETAIAG